jgi:hypothetical protein
VIRSCAGSGISAQGSRRRVEQDGQGIRDHDGLHVAPGHFERRADREDERSVPDPRDRLARVVVGRTDGILRRRAIPDDAFAVHAVPDEDARRRAAFEAHRRRAAHALAVPEEGDGRGHSPSVRPSCDRGQSPRNRSRRGSLGARTLGRRCCRRGGGRHRRGSRAAWGPLKVAPVVKSLTFAPALSPQEGPRACCPCRGWPLARGPAARRTGDIDDPGSPAPRPGPEPRALREEQARRPTGRLPPAITAAESSRKPKTFH